jgi:hypothetical protein
MIQTIYILWIQGFDNAPLIVKECVKSWKYYNPDWNIILLDKTNLSTYINISEHIDLSGKDINNTTLSEIIRVILLKLYGGLWTDATTFCNRPLNEWLPNYIKDDFFAFEKPGPDRLLSSWFLYSEPDTYIINNWYKQVLIYYTTNNKPHTYFWFHYLFGDLYNSDIKFRELWDKVIKLPANNYGPHYLQERGMFDIKTNEIKFDIDKKITPLYKLTYKCDFPPPDTSLNVYYLFSTLK